jgi:hypothetical protein
MIVVLSGEANAKSTRGVEHPGATQRSFTELQTVVTFDSGGPSGRQLALQLERLSALLRGDLLCWMQRRDCDREDLRVNQVANTATTCARCAQWCGNNEPPA